jgi:hypothetical protein
MAFKQSHLRSLLLKFAFQSAFGSLLNAPSNPSRSATKDCGVELVSTSVSRSLEARCRLPTEGLVTQQRCSRPTRGCGNSWRTRYLAELIETRFKQASTFNSTMGRRTRSGYRESTPTNQLEATEANTVKKRRFYSLFDAKPANQSLRAFSQVSRIPESTARRWLRQREILGTPAYRRTRRLSQRIGPPLKVTHRQVQSLLDHDSNPVRNEPLSVQIAHHKLDISERQLQYRLSNFDSAQLYKAAFVKDDLTERVKALRCADGLQHQHESIDSYWRLVVFTDEFHLDPSQQRAPRILRSAGTRYQPENIAIRPPKIGVVLHCAGWINWYAKCDQLEFYNDKA